MAAARLDGVRPRAHCRSGRSRCSRTFLHFIFHFPFAIFKLITLPTYAVIALYWQLTPYTLLTDPRLPDRTADIVYRFFRRARALRHSGGLGAGVGAAARSAAVAARARVARLTLLLLRPARQVAAAAVADAVQQRAASERLGG